MNTIATDVKQGKILVSDGAWGTFLHEKGLLPGECPEMWNLSRPDEVFMIAKSYIDAGSDIIETNSFGGNPFKLAAFGLAEKTYDINRAAAAISRRAAGDNKHVLGSIGPTGKMIIMGDVTAEELYVAFKEQAIALFEGGADALVVETMSDIEEARAAVKACKENTRAEVICTMTFEKTGDNIFHTMMGITPSVMAAEMFETGADIIGANCGNGIRNMIGIVKEIRSVNKEIPILIHANAGAPVYRDGKTMFPESPEEMAEFVEMLVEEGANVIGGCCGTTPHHIRKIAEIIKRIR
ncbi:MAG TPA: homocysteine S-methyltransferase family protein [Bacteroidales bacterium]|jgi:5-methyltetrahydrofolate--homocysteine methyltransferase|nr:homocysteine S-methyltransferase family protein [Bacteroidales bacterium]